MTVWCITRMGTSWEMSLIKRGSMTDKYKIVRMTARVSFRKKVFSDSEMEEHFKDMASQGYSFVRYIPVLWNGCTYQLHLIFEKKDG